MAEKTQRLRDPVHGLIVFRENDPVDQLAWSLIQAPEFQRLRRICQLGVSEFVFPGATHSRLIHSIGVFHVARQLRDIIDRETDRNGMKFNHERADAAVIAALLHDVGHGPFSHAFEHVSKKQHEIWTKEIIRSQDGSLWPKLAAFNPDNRFPHGKFAADVVHFFEVEDPEDIYHAIVSSSLDADRLDYLRRDKLMTGTGAGAIDFDWILEHVRVAEISIDAADSEDNTENGGLAKVPTFCLDVKALPAAEQFLLSRYTLHEQVYFHKTTRCVEKMIGKILGLVRELAMQADAPQLTGLAQSHPLLQYFGANGAILGNYLRLDDFAVLSALEAMAEAQNHDLANLATRLRERRLYKTLDLGVFGKSEEAQIEARRRIEAAFKAGLGGGMILKDDEASINIYTHVGGDDDKMHKKLHILDAGVPREITYLSPMIKELEEKKRFIRYYFADESDREKAVEVGKGGTPHV